MQCWRAGAPEETARLPAIRAASNESFISDLPRQPDYPPLERLADGVSVRPQAGATQWAGHSRSGIPSQAGSPAGRAMEAAIGRHPPSQLVAAWVDGSAEFDAVRRQPVRAPDSARAGGAGLLLLSSAGDPGRWLRRWNRLPVQRPRRQPRTCRQPPHEPTFAHHPVLVLRYAARRHPALAGRKDGEAAVSRGPSGRSHAMRYSATRLVVRDQAAPARDRHSTYARRHGGLRGLWHREPGRLPVLWRMCRTPRRVCPRRVYTGSRGAQGRHRPLRGPRRVHCPLGVARPRGRAGLPAPLPRGSHLRGRPPRGPRGPASSATGSWPSSGRRPRTKTTPNGPSGRPSEALSGSRPLGLDLHARIGINTGARPVRRRGGRARRLGDRGRRQHRRPASGPRPARRGGHRRGNVPRQRPACSSGRRCRPSPLKGKAEPGRRSGGRSAAGRPGSRARARRRARSWGARARAPDGRRAVRARPLDAVGGGRPRSSPKPGIGKSRLVRELGRHLDARPELISWRVGRCRPYGEGVGFAPPERDRPEPMPVSARATIRRP